MTPFYNLGADALWRSRGWAPIDASNPNPPDPTDPDAKYPALPSLVSVNYTDLFHAGDTVQAALNRLTSYAVVNLPDGFDEDFYDFNPVNHYGLFNSFVLGFDGSSADQCRFRLHPQSSTQGGLVPAQSAGGTNPLTLLRVGAGNSHLAQTMLHGVTLEGTMQPPNSVNTGPSHNYSGFINYYGRNAVVQSCKFILAAVGDWNSPPGETFQINNFHDQNSIYRNVEVTGISSAGEDYGGSPFGCNGSTNVSLEDCNFHDSLVSGLTFSIAGSITDMASATSGVSTKNVTVARNANHVLGPGTRFTGFNHENVMGTIRHENPDITMTNMTEWNASHMSFVNHLIDNQDITIINPNVHGIGPARYNGCFIVSMAVNYGGSASTQVTPPKVLQNGVSLKPNFISANGSNTGLNPATDYVVIHA